MTHPEISLEDSLSAAARALSARKQLGFSFLGNAAPDLLQPRESLNLPTPHDAPEARGTRGMADMASFAHLYHDAALYRQHAPHGEHEREIHHALEEMRVGLLGGERYAGVRSNLDAMFNRRPLPAEAGPAQLPIAQMLAFLLRERHGGAQAPAQLQPYLRSHERWLTNHAIPLLSQMDASLADQRRFSELSRQLIELLKGLQEEGEPSSHASATTDDETAENRESHAETEGEAPADMEAAGEDETSGDPSAWGEMSVESIPGEMTPSQGQEVSAPMQMSDAPEYMHGAPESDYRIFTTQFDEIVPAHKLASLEEAIRLRAQLDDKLSEIRGTFAKFSAQLQRILLARQRRSWDFDLEEGRLHSARLAQMIVSPRYNRVFKQESEADFKDTVVTLLLDNSGSMRGRPITLAAISADILAKTLERAGVKVEILGFTTRDWKGGDAFREWVRTDKPIRPGRLNDIRHIIYKSADQPFSRARRNLGLMLKDGLLKENIDGEALLWAHHRLLARAEKRRILMVISDGAPVDDSTLSANGAAYLDRHLREVITMIEKRNAVELLAIGIGHDVSRYYKRSVTINDASRLGETMTKELVELFKR